MAAAPPWIGGSQLMGTRRGSPLSGTLGTTDGLIAPQFATNTADLLQLLSQQPPGPSLAPPPVEPEFMPELTKAMIGVAWFELQALANEQFPPHCRRQPFLTPEQRKVVQRAWQKRVREAEAADIDA
ncbi:hypothetical protein KBZ19_09795 [Synechococcus sp. L2F]|uniref:hypothetical protein n=1 Tax=Synechococcus sp. L2F TaxID=2823739 RepID=UPI0020CFAA0A|nr:hypothetical protein [Synechococcus sp. L2F]MCP9828777.1 hypothetical protein [Synechococcus sp. L2F]